MFSVDDVTEAKYTGNSVVAGSGTLVIVRDREGGRRNGDREERGRGGGE